MTDPTTLNWISERAPLSTSLQTPLNACVWHSFIHSFTYAYSFILASLNFNNDILAIRTYQFGCTDLPSIPRYSGIFVSRFVGLELRLLLRPLSHLAESASLICPHASFWLLRYTRVAFSQTAVCTGLSFTLSLLSFFLVQNGGSCC